jgi:drug/metabolite transporter (DMT)-like permease
LYKEENGGTRMERIKGALCLTGAFMLAGTSVVAARFVSGSLGTFTIAAVSLFFASVCLLTVCGRKLIETIKGMKPGDWRALLMQAVFGIFLFRLFLLQGLIRTSTGEAGILTGATPAATALLAAVLLKENLHKSRIAGLCITVAGILLLQGLLIPGSGLDSSHFAGNMLVLCAAFSESLFNILSRFRFIKTTGRKSETDPLQQTALVSIIAFLFCLIPAILENPVQPLIGLNMGQWFALVWYGVVVTALAFYFWYAGIKRCEASVAAIFSGMMPFTAVLLSVILLGERPVWQQYLGGFMVMAGMVISGFRQKAIVRQA